MIILKLTFLEVFQQIFFFYAIFRMVRLFVKGVGMQIKSRVHKDVLYVLLCGELDEHSASYTRLTLDEIFENDNFNRIVIDLSELVFMDSTGIGVLIGRYKKMKGRDIPIYITNPSSHIEKIFKITGLYDIMPKIV